MYDVTYSKLLQNFTYSIYKTIIQRAQKICDTESMQFTLPEHVDAWSPSHAFSIFEEHCMEHTSCPPELLPDLVAFHWPTMPVKEATLLQGK